MRICVGVRRLYWCVCMYVACECVRARARVCVRARACTCVRAFLQFVWVGVDVRRGLWVG